MSTRWSEDELELLRDTSLSLAEVAQQTGRTLSSVEHKAIRLGIDRSFRAGIGLKRGDDNPWTEAELAVLADRSLSLGEVSARTGRAYGAVKQMASRLGERRNAKSPEPRLLRERGVSIPSRRRSWTEADLALLADVSVSLVEVARRLDRPVGTVYSEASLRGIVRGVRRGEHHYRWTGGEDQWHRGPDWPQVRLIALERDGYTCQDCGLANFVGQQLHVHHIIPWRLRPVNDLNWLVTLCTWCHIKRPEHRWTEIPEDVQAALAGFRWEGGDRSV